MVDMDITAARIRRPSSTPAMSALPTSFRLQLLAPVLRPHAARAIAPIYRAYSTNEPEAPHQHKTTSEDAPAVPLTSDSTQIRDEGASAGMAHAPDYNVAVDYRTSCATIQPSHART